MSTFVQKKNVISGSNVWVEGHEDYDHYQEVARSSFADMLHDTERNQMYEAALKIAIEQKHREGKKAIVLDIGTGTGLLSMMAARNGADKVTACEAFKPMSECAVKIIELNGFKDKIKVIPKQSIYLTVGKDEDLDEKCNILVTEVFDTELIGEAAIFTFNHALESLLTEDCIVVPDSATIYVQIVECPLVQEWNRLSDINENGKMLLEVPEIIKSCDGCAAVHDIQLSQLPRDSFKTLVKPTAIFSFRFTETIPLKRSIIKKFKTQCDGEAQAVFMWWDLKMDIKNNITLRCDPHWNHPLSKDDKNMKIPWRDHWMQAIYYFPKQVKFQKGEELILVSNHDSYSLWFNVERSEINIQEKEFERHDCNCRLHLLPRSRIGQLNDNNRTKVLMNVIRENVEGKNVLIVGDGFFLSLVASKFNVKKLYILDTDSFSKKITLDFISVNKIENVSVYDNTDDLEKETMDNTIDVVLAEPYFVSSILPWDNLFFHFTVKKIRHLLTFDVSISPTTASIKAVAVQFDDLHKIRTPIRECEGLKMGPFDQLIEASSKICDELVEAQPLWEYPCIALGPVEEFHCSRSSDLEFLEAVQKRGTLKIECDKPCNGIAIWVDWYHESCDANVIWSGPTAPIEVGKRIQWDRNCRQGVYLFENRNVYEIEYGVKLDYLNAEVKFEFQ